MGFPTTVHWAFFLVCAHSLAICDGAVVLGDNTPHGTMATNREETAAEIPNANNTMSLSSRPAGHSQFHLAPTGTQESLNDKCRCNGSVADCSQNGGSLTFIPRLPPEVTFVNFTWNNLTSIPDAGFFLNVTHITGLDLSDNGLCHIHPTSFQLLVNLQRLILRGHGLDYVGLTPVLQVRTLHYLDVSVSSLGPVPAGLFDEHPLPLLHTLAINDSGIYSLNLTEFQPLVRLQKLEMGGNEISHQVHTCPLPSLEVFTLTRNGIFHFPDTCTEDGTSLLPRLTALYLKNNLLSALPDRICLPSLAILVLSSNMFSHLATDMFSHRRFPALFALYLDAMSTQISSIDSHAFRNPALGNLSLMYNNIDLAVEEVHPDSFRGLTGLKKLQMGHNYVNYVTSDRFVTLFGSLVTLEVIEFGLDFIHNMTADMVRPFRSLRRLYFYDNEMTGLPDGVFDSLHNLSHLYLGGNRLNTITENTFSVDTRRRLQLVDLSGDQFMCTCDLMWFRDWLVSNVTQFTPSWYTYHCKNLPGLSVQEFFLAEQACLFSQPTYQFITISFTVLILTMTFISGLFRFRWHLRLMLYEAFRGHSDLRMRRLQTERFEYDVFVSYAGEDLPWVRQQLIPELEGGLGLKLCIHERDFTLGRNIVDNIVESVERSKKILMVFSRSFTRSQWCQFELALCLRSVMEYDDSLVIVCMNDVWSRDMTGAMMAVLKTTTYIEWAEHPDAVASFWGRMATALQEILPPV